MAVDAVCIPGRPGSNGDKGRCLALVGWLVYTQTKSNMKTSLKINGFHPLSKLSSQVVNHFERHSDQVVPVPVPSDTSTRT